MNARAIAKVGERRINERRAALREEGRSRVRQLQEALDEVARLKTENVLLRARVAADRGR